MNTNLSKFDLIASMMKRLDVSPSALTMNWLQEQVLSFACLARSSHQDEPEQRLVGTFCFFGAASCGCRTCCFVTAGGRGCFKFRRGTGAADFRFSEQRGGTKAFGR